MHSYKEIVARLVIVASVLIIVETRARYIYQPGPFVECMKLEIPCGGHSKETCNEYCENDGFASGSCNGHCCFCHARTGMLPQIFQRQHSVGPKPTLFNTLLELETKQIAVTEPEKVETTTVETTKPKRFASISGSDISAFANRNGIAKDRDAVKVEDEICLTPACIKTANAILDNLDETVSPCDDFYKFTCGNFQKDQRIPDDKGAVTLIGSLTDKLMEQLREMLETGNDSGKPLSHSATLAKTLYDSCRNSDLLESRGVSPLNDLLKTLGGWPVLEGNKWDSTAWSWQKTVSNFRKSGLVPDYLLKVAVVPDLKHPSRRILNIAEPVLAFSREQLRNPAFSSEYHQFQIKVAVLLGAEKVQADSELAKVLEFEKILANISLPRELARAHPLNFHHPMTVSELQSRFPSVQWLSYINALLPHDAEVNEDQIINVHAPEQLTVLLNAIDKTDKRVLANYLLWRASSSVISHLSEDAKKIQHEFLGAVSGQRQRKPRWRGCVDIVSTTLGQAVGAMYVRRHFDETSRETALEMVNDIRTAFVDILTTMDWMDVDTKRRALGKAAAMKTNIGYPEQLLNEDILRKLYDGLELSPDNFFGNLLNLTKGSADFALRKVKQPVDKNDWLPFGKPAIVNAFYQPSQNSIQFPAGILQGHFFNKERPQFMNYGSIGWVIGHEISHGFDDQGSHFDHNGEVRDWWNPKTKQLFHEKARCIVNQYGSFSYTDLVRNVTIPLNGIVSVGENIADNGGIKQAYKGYQSWVQRNGQEKKLPGLNYTPNQLFWISAATNWCNKVRPQQMIEEIQMGVHSPGEFRVRGTFANMEQFSKDFNCPVGAPMNPPSKCEVW
ncbi:unnamed protein product [Orchesella dallaii]|uniref:Uncharacterized protein n=1 Tax=Orchesella dallaii TaxID=48710 RepID=A0ABP1RC64_9HEXA